MRYAEAGLGTVAALVLALGLPLAFRGATPATPAVDLGAEMARAAEAFLTLLDDDARQLATYPLDDDERFNWHFVPRERNGLPLKQMTGEQRRAAHAMLLIALSAQGYLKATGVMELERILGILENRPERRDPEQYFFTIFGAPSADEPWAWRFEGHHLSINFTSVTNEVVVTGPAFMGANPATVPSGPKAGWRVLAAEEDLARTLARSLSDAQRRSAVIAEEAPRDIITGADREARLEDFEGLPTAEMTDAQRALLMRLIEEYVHNMEHATALRQMERVQATPADRLYFAWAGPLEPGGGHYYRVHAPSFLIEYDNTQGNANHIHSVWRDLENDFGGDLLRRHYEQAEHHRNER